LNTDGKQKKRQEIDLDPELARKKMELTLKQYIKEILYPANMHGISSHYSPNMQWCNYVTIENKSILERLALTNPDFLPYKADN
jgi:hypothetical protein